MLSGIEYPTTFTVWTFFLDNYRGQILVAYKGGYMIKSSVQELNGIYVGLDEAIRVKSAMIASDSQRAIQILKGTGGLVRNLDGIPLGTFSLPTGTTSNNNSEAMSLLHVYAWHCNFTQHCYSSNQTHS
ncbi:hypothetical protein ACHQM5_002597 [Ranunculus cassubicifolius]